MVHFSLARAASRGSWQTMMSNTRGPLTAILLGVILETFLDGTKITIPPHRLIRPLHYDSGVYIVLFGTSMYLLLNRDKRNLRSLILSSKGAIFLGNVFLLFTILAVRSSVHSHACYSCTSCSHNNVAMGDRYL